MAGSNDGGGTQIPLLSTKLHAPRRRNVMDRPGLLQRLDRTDLPALIVVSAGPGFGKTTLVAEWFADERTTAWVSLDRRDNDPAVFWSYVTHAVRTATSSDASAPSDQPSIDAAVASLVNTVSDAPDDVVLVLDDYHVIEAAEIHESIEFLLDHAPPNLHVVVVGRADPPLRLAAWRAKGELLELRASDLRFTTDEITTYLGDTLGVGLAPSDIDALDRRTEGWITAVKLAAISLQGRDDAAGFVADFAGDDRFILDYLVEEVLERQPTDVRQFLLRTSILGRLNASLCEAVTELPDGRAMLERLERSNLFLVPLDDQRSWYRYHHLFADVLRARLLDEDPDAIPELHRRACDWHVTNGDRAEAVSYALAGGHVDRAADLIEAGAPALRRSRQDATLRSWLEALPPEAFVNRPVLALNLVGARMVHGDPTGVERLLDDIEATAQLPSAEIRVVDEAEYRRAPAQVLVFRAALALFAGEIDRTIVHATEALDSLESDDHLRRGSASGLLALARWASGDLEAAADRYVEAVDALIAAEHLPDALGCSLALADVQLAMGRLGDARRTLESGLEWTTRHAGLRGAADMHVGLAEVLIERDDLDGAAAHLATSTELGERAGLPQHAYRWRVTTARLLRARGDLDGALALIDEAQPLYDTDFSPPVRPVEAIRARVQLACGDLTAVQTWIDRTGLGVDDDLSYVREYEHLTLARVLLARRDLDRAAALLGRLLAAATDGHRNGSAVETLILLAATEHERGDRAAAQAALDDALRRAEPEGHVRLFLHAGPAVTDMVRSAATRPDASPHARAVRAAADRARPAVTAPRTSSALIDDLSPRERDVLRLLRSDLSGPEIARELIVSLNTVRTHTKAIYSKLGVTSRREAVRRAGELGL